MTREELLNCLIDRPCSACKFNKENGCCKWTCVFEEEIEEDKNCTSCILDGTDACIRGAGRAVDDEICDMYMSEEENK